MENLWLNNNKLSGTPSLLILPGVVVRVYHCNHVVVVVVVVVVAAAVQMVLQVALQVTVNAKMCTDALSVTHLAHRSRGVQGVHEEESASMRSFPPQMTPIATSPALRRVPCVITKPAKQETITQKSKYEVV
jgi:hypothetical protein